MANVIDEGENLAIFAVVLGIAGVMYWLWQSWNDGAGTAVKGAEQEATATVADMRTAFYGQSPDQVAADTANYWQTVGQINDANKAAGITPDPSSDPSFPNWPSWSNYLSDFAKFNWLPWNWNKPFEGTYQ
jgi:hypothetical protein